MQPRRSRQSAAAVCYRCDNEVELKLVRTVTGDHWIFPKGKIKKYESGPEAAAREASEEAGVAGHVDPMPRGEYTQIKAGEEVTVVAYLLAVTSDGGRHEAGRDPQWLTIPQARAALREGRSDANAARLIQILDAAVARISMNAEP